MKKTLVFLFVMSIALIGFAQRPYGPKNGIREPKPAEQRAENITARMNQRLQFSETQRAQIKAINLTAAQKMDEVYAKYKDAERTPENMKAAREARKEINKERDASIQALLTDEQKPEYTKMKEEVKARNAARREKMKENRKKGNVPPPPADDIDEIDPDGN